MAILNIRTAKRGETKALITIAGVSGSGKTYTALKIARGMVTHPSKIGLLDTENGRGSFYSDILDGEFLIGDLYAPFSPNRYSEAIKEFQAAGIEVLVIDSATHEWEGEGGCDDIAQAPIEQGKKMADWASAKRQHKRFMNTLLQCNMHIICCVRAREKVKIEGGRVIPQGLQPICEKNFMFEMTASIMIYDEGKRQENLKMPSFLRAAFGTGNDYLGEKTGRDIITWINSGEKEDTEIKRFKSEMQMATEEGVAALGKVWATVPAHLQPLLLNHKDTCKASALEYEAQAKSAADHFDGMPDDEKERIAKDAADVYAKPETK